MANNSAAWSPVRRENAFPLIKPDSRPGRSGLSSGSRRKRCEANKADGLSHPRMDVTRRGEVIRLMSTNVLTVDLPSNLSEDEVKLLLAIKLYEVGKVSLGQAAKLAGFSKRAFMEVLGRYQVPVFNYSPEELRRELDA